jgi:hypothetical protein
MENNYGGEIKNEEEGNVEDYQDDLNQNNKDFNQEAIDDQVEDIEEEDDDRLTYTLITLDLGNLIHIFEDNNISFVDMLLLSKEDLIELQLEIFQRNRILNFSKLFTKYAKNYSIREISDFFTFNKQFIFNSSIYDKVFTNNMYANANDTNNNSNYNMDNTNNYDPDNLEQNYINTNPNLNERQNFNNNYMNQSMHNNPSNYITNNSSNAKLGNKLISPKNKEPQIKSQNINGGSKKNKNIPNKNATDPDNFQGRLQDFMKKRKTPQNQSFTQNLPKGNNKKNMNIIGLDRNEEYQKVIDKIGLLDNAEMNYDLYTRLNLIKNYINNKGDKITIQDLMNINNDVDSMIEAMNNNLNNKSDIKLNNNIDNNKTKNKIKVTKKQ